MRAVSGPRRSGWNSRLAAASSREGQRAGGIGCGRARRRLAGWSFAESCVMQREHSPRRRAALALALLVPAPSLGSLAAFVWPQGASGQSVYLACKAWIALLPLAWLLRVERGRPSLSPLAPRRRRAGLLAGLALGLAMAAVILGVWFGGGSELVDVGRLRAAEEAAGLTSAPRYLAFSLYIVLVNSLLEEYVWRWFCFRQCELLVGRALGVLLSAACFTAHHVIVFCVQMDPPAAALASLGVFLAGCAWSICYGRFRSIWPGYLSHALADVAGLWIGWRILFAGG